MLAPRRCLSARRGWKRDGTEVQLTHYLEVPLRLSAVAAQKNKKWTLEDAAID